MLSTSRSLYGRTLSLLESNITLFNVHLRSDTFRRTDRRLPIVVPKRIFFTENPPRIPPIRVHPTTAAPAESPSTSASLGSHSSQPLLILPRACISSVGLEPRACAREAPARQTQASFAIDFVLPTR